MQSSIIQDVIGKIISINKDLDEESLINLLIASGWDKSDIEMGRIFFIKSLNKFNLVEGNEGNSLSVDTAFNNCISNQSTEIVEYKDTLMPVKYNSYNNGLSNIEDNTKISLDSYNVSGEKIQTHVNIVVLLLLLIALALYISSFSS